MENSWGFISIVACICGFLIAYFGGKVFYTSLLSNTSIKKVKESAVALKVQRSEYEANIKIYYSGIKMTTYNKYTSYVLSELKVKNDGLLVAPYWGHNFGIMFQNIISINIRRSDEKYLKPQVVIIKSFGSVNDNIIFEIKSSEQFINIIKQLNNKIIIQNELEQ